MRRFDLINVIPFIDIVLVMLAIVLTTATFIAQSVINIEVPDTEHNAPLSQQAYREIAIDEQGRFYFDGQIVNREELASGLQELMRTTAIVLRVDRSVSFEKFITVVELLKAGSNGFRSSPVDGSAVLEPIAPALARRCELTGIFLAVCLHAAVLLPYVAGSITPAPAATTVVKLKLAMFETAPTQVAEATPERPLPAAKPKSRQKTGPRQEPEPEAVPQPVDEPEPEPEPETDEPFQTSIPLSRPSPWHRTSRTLPASIPAWSLAWRTAIKRN